MRAQVYDLGKPQLFGPEVNITIVVQRNNNPPFFINDPYTRTIAENQAVGTLVYDTSASDLDILAPFNTLTYAIIGDDSAPTYFSINSTTGDVFLTNSVQLDTQSQYQLRLLVSDGGIPSRMDSAILTVSVTRNLFSPVINPLNYEATIFEDTFIGEEIVRVLATDQDVRSPHNDIRYEAVGTNSGNTLTYFGIGSTDGSVFVRRSLTTDNNQQNEFTMFVRAFDLGVPQRSSANQATVRILVLRNRNCPVFANLPTNITISQSQNTQTRIFNVSATDLDAAGRFSTLTYSLVGDDNAAVLFNIDPNNGFIFISNTGLISDRSSVYKESCTCLQLRVRASDGGYSPCTRDSVLTVNVLRNELAPVFQPSSIYRVTILETLSTAESIFTVTARDNDLQPWVMVRVRVKVMLNCLSDGGNPRLSDTTVVIVYVNRNLFPPVFSPQQYSATILDTQAIGVPIAELSLNQPAGKHLHHCGEKQLCTSFPEHAIPNQHTGKPPCSSVRLQDFCC
ncbi:hypothetical protein DPMN_036526 [Dreissena polymorpha]|uniref:Cadherin domain-containing protein n=1 Tax=Dreissena polymorpha TaxID=45954 RepID=A0A9D4MCP1_DREPO|nr:hypothetical protein DPMN_036526 [Dreissena polymorpha]